MSCAYNDIHIRDQPWTSSGFTGFSPNSNLQYLPDIQIQSVPDIPYLNLLQQCLGFPIVLRSTIQHKMCSGLGKPSNVTEAEFRQTKNGF